MEKLPDNAEPKTASSALGVGTILAAFRRRPFLTAAVVLAATAASACAWKLLPDPKNTAYVLFQIESAQPHILNPQQGDSLTVFRQSQGALVKSRHVLSAALKDPKVSDCSLLRKAPDKVATLEKLAKVDYRTGPEFMRVSIEGDDADDLMVIINAISESYLDHVVNKRSNHQRTRRLQLQETADSLRKRVAETARKLSQAINQQADLAADATTLDINTHRTQLVQQKLEAETQLRQAEIELDLLKNPPSSLTSDDENAISDHRRRLLDADTTYRGLRDQRDAKKAYLLELRKVLTANATNPKLAATEAELKGLEQQCRDIENHAQAEAEAAVAKLAEQNRATEIVKAELQYNRRKRSVEILDKALKELNSKEKRRLTQVNDPEGLRLTFERDNGLLSRVLGELEVLDLESKAPDRVTKLEAGVLPGVEGGKRFKMAVAGGFGVLGLGLAGLVLLERRNPRVMTSHQLTDQLRLPVLGVLPALQPAPKSAPSSGQAVGNLDWQVAAMEAVCGTRTILQYGVSAAAQQARVILVGSAVSGEGKTSLAQLLARSLAQAGNRTLLLDGDLRRPSLHNSLAVPSGPGLCEYLIGAAELSSICYSSDAQDLTVIPAGTWSEAASQALAGPVRWPDLVRRMTVEYDYVLIDSSPLLPVADALLMARVVDGVLLTVMQEVSEVNAIKEALAQLALIGARVLGVVVNGGPVRRYYRSRYVQLTNVAPEAEPAAPIP